MNKQKRAARAASHNFARAAELAIVHKLAFLADCERRGYSESAALLLWQHHLLETGTGSFGDGGHVVLKRHKPTVRGVYDGRGRAGKWRKLDIVSG